MFTFSPSLFVITTASAARPRSTARGIHEFAVPAAICIVEVHTIFSLLAKPERFVQADTYSVEPRVSRCFVSEEEYNVNFFKGAECGLRKEEVYERNDGEVSGGEDDPGTIADVGERDRGDEDDAVISLVNVASLKILRGIYTKLISQLPIVLIALAGPRILNGTISTWYNHAIPCHPMAKNMENPNRKTVLAILAALLP
jgi:hypothetical protein